MSRLAVLLAFASVAVAAATAPPPVQSEERRIAVLIDTSGSMKSSDPQRYTAQIAKILADIAKPDDDVTVIRIPQLKAVDFLSLLVGGREDCSAGPSSSLARHHRGADTTAFKGQIDALVTYDTENYFAAPIRTAMKALTLDRTPERMLLMLADSGGLGPCAPPLTGDLVRLRDSGAVVAAINLGGAGAFEGNPAFDFTIGVRDSRGMMEAVAEVYQRFLGAKSVQTGRVDGLVEVEIDPHVAQAYLVVAADGPLGRLEEAAGNPGARETELDHRGGGTTTGLDRVARGYRIVRLDAPAPGRWRFRAHGLTGSAGWLLIQDSSIGLQLVSPPQAALGLATPLEAELYDTVTGKRIDEPCDLPGLKLTATIDGARRHLADDGAGLDREAGDCVFTTVATFDEAGRRNLSVELDTAHLEKRFDLSVDVVERAWRIEPEVPEQAEAGGDVPLKVRLEPLVTAPAQAPAAVVVEEGGDEIARLTDDGEGADDAAGDRTYSGSFHPTAPGDLRLEFRADGGAASIPGRAELGVRGFLRLADPPPIRFGSLTGGDEGSALLDVSGSRAEGAYTLRLTSDYRAGRSVLEVDAGEGWVRLAGQPVPVRFSRSGPRTLPLRLRVAECPEAVASEAGFQVQIEGTGPDGTVVNASAPLSVTVVADPWLECWWPILATGAGLGLIGVLFHGFWSPSRFSRRLAVHLSPEADMGEGYPHSVRRTRGSGSGFYRNATVYVCEDYRLAGRADGALACLRADGRRVRIRPVNGSVVWRRAAAGEWERLTPDETAARFGTLYRNDTGNLFFELRNA